ncbi:MAG: ATP-binding protein [Candidatus Thermoplasmatota archaeon]|nr:ATP-binding protein [Candidatus Thermoplasmatota archaeon]
MDPVGILYGDIHPTVVNCSVMGKLRQGDYVRIKHQEDGWVLGKVDSIEAKTNLSIEKSYKIMEGSNVEIQQAVSAQIVIIGYLDQKRILQYPRTPFLAGTPVYLADDEFIASTLNISAGKKGRAYVGLIYGHSIPFSIDINAMVQKHISVMAKTGGGKSYLTGVIVEELIKNDVTVVIIDPHGEYGSMKKKASDTDEMKRFSIRPGSYGEKIITFAPERGDEKLTFTLSQINVKELVSIMNLSDPKSYVLPLRKAIDAIRLSSKDYDFDDITKELKRQDDSSLSQTLEKELLYLKSLNVLGKRGLRVDELVVKGKVSIIEMKGLPPDVQELIVQRLLYALFEARKKDRIPPLLTVVEEAHNFAPQQGKAFSSKIMRTVASEGRKFGFGLLVVSQRPAKIDKNVLSQCGTQLILKVTNPNDLKAIGNSVEGLTTSSLDEIQRLPVGISLIASPDLPIPLFVEVRPRETDDGGKNVRRGE